MPSAMKLVAASYQFVHYGTHMIRWRYTSWPSIRVIRKDLKDGNLGRYEQPGPAVVACINERNESPRLGEG
jgi:hypothetical protein